jgi:GST-like protein
MIDFYTWGTPNGHKIRIMLEACGLEYRLHLVNILNKEQFAPEFLKISPNNKIPAIVDSEGPGGQPISVFESGAILIYLAEKCGRYLPQDPRQRVEVMEWLMWQMGGFGPMLGQAHHFNKFAPEPVPYAIERYCAEAHRLWGVLDERLASREFVCGQMSIADFAIYPWANRFEFQKIEPEQYANVHRWMEHMKSFDFVQTGLLTPEG